jgi:hypothetical protein
MASKYDNDSHQKQQRQVKEQSRLSKLSFECPSKNLVLRSHLRKRLERAAPSFRARRPAFLKSLVFDKGTSQNLSAMLKTGQSG